MTVCWVGKREVFVSSVRDNLGPLSHQTRNCQPCNPNHNQRYFGVSHTPYERMTQWKSHSIGGSVRISVSPYFWKRIRILCELLEKRIVSYEIVKAKHQQDCTVGTFLRYTEFEEGPEKIATMNRVRMNHSCCQKNWDSSTHRSLAILFLLAFFYFFLLQLRWQR